MSPKILHFSWFHSSLESVRCSHIGLILVLYDKNFFPGRNIFSGAEKSKLDGFQVVLDPANRFVWWFCIDMACVTFYLNVFSLNARSFWSWEGYWVQVDDGVGGGERANTTQNQKVKNFWNWTTPGRTSMVPSVPQARQGHLWAIQIDCRVAPRRVASKNVIFSAGPVVCRCKCLL